MQFVSAVVSSTHNFEAVGPPLVSCLHSYAPHLDVVSSIRDVKTRRAFSLCIPCDVATRTYRKTTVAADWLKIPALIRRSGARFSAVLTDGAPSPSR